MYAEFGQSLRKAAEQCLRDQESLKAMLPESERRWLERHRLGTPKAEEPSPRDIAPF